MARPLPVSFVAGTTGSWEITSIVATAGTVLPDAPRLEMIEGPVPASSGAIWIVRGTTSNERYVERAERAAMAERPNVLGRPEARCAAMIPITKSEAWWELPQDERRAILEASSRHIAIGLEYVPAIARRLHHGRDLGEPFDFVTWFEFAPSAVGLFDELLERLRATAEWAYVEREVDVRLSR